MRSLHRYFLEFSYKGTAFHGWQVQLNAPSVQEQINKALSILLKHEVDTVGCGRTDTGVHAKQFFAHFDTTVEFDARFFVTQLNALLPPDIAIKRVLEVSRDAHARFDATLRSYEYHIHFNKNPFKEGLSWQFRDAETFNVERMNEGALLLQEYEEFGCFCKSNSQNKTNICHLKEAYWTRTDEALVFYISADRFLRNMVRAIVGTLIDLGKEKQTLSNLKKIVESQDRRMAGTSVPACGLYLTRIEYPFL